MGFGEEVISIDRLLSQKGVARRTENLIKWARVELQCKTVQEMAQMLEAWERGKLPKPNQHGPQALKALREAINQCLTSPPPVPMYAEAAAAFLVDPALTQKLLPYPAGRISVRRLSLPNEVQEQIVDEGFMSVGALARVHRGYAGSLLERHLACYLHWLAEQTEEVWEAEIEDRGISPIYRILMGGASLDEWLTTWLAPLDNEKQINGTQSQVLRQRYGISGKSSTLGEISAEILVTRERARQKAKQAVKNLRKQPDEGSQLMVSLIVDLLIRAGGLMSGSEVGAALCYELTVEQVVPAAVAQLLAEVTPRFYCEDGFFCLNAAHLQSIPKIQEQLLEQLEPKHVLPREELIKAFQASAFAQTQQAWDNAFIRACLRIHPQLRYDGPDCFLMRHERDRLPLVILALRRSKGVMHYEDVTRAVNAKLSIEEQVQPDNIHALMERHAWEIFVRRGHGKFRLRRDTDRDDRCVADAAYHVLCDAGHPLSLSQIATEVLKNWEVEDMTVYAAVYTDLRFCKMPQVGVYGLVEWRILETPSRTMP